MKMVGLLQSTISVAAYVTRIILGLGVAIFFIFYTIFFALPIHLYRWFVLKVFVRAFGPPDLRKGVNSLGNGLALEFRESGDLHWSRFTIVVNFVFQGHVSYEELYDRIDQQWIKARTKTGELKYPEFQQYLTSWMSFMFLNQESDFKLKDHIKVHKIENKLSDEKGCEKFKNDLNQDLLNDKWIAQRSPWEVHLVPNFHRSRLGNSDISNQEDNHNDEISTLIIFRVHHGLADGFAVLYALVEQLFGNSLQTDSIARPASAKKKVGILSIIGYYIKLIVKTIHAMGCCLWIIMKWKTPLHCDNPRKKRPQIYHKGPLVPVSKIKLIKNRFGVSFGTVLDSAVGVALGKTLKIKMEKCGWWRSMPNTMAYGIAIPLPNHPKVLRNHLGIMLYEVPISPEADALDLLQKCEENISHLKLYPWIMILSFISRTTYGMPTYIAKYLGTNKFVATGVSSFPGSLGQLWWKERKLVAADFAANNGSGVGGIGFYALSYMDKVQVNVTAEEAVLTRAEVAQICEWVTEQIEILYELAKENGNESNAENSREICKLELE